MNLRSPTGRAPGLDTLRAAAIALVFMYHYMVFVSHRPTFGWLSVVGWAGVDLFFVLSGYLISDQLLAGIADRQVLSLKNFYARRALRTLPVFWFILALYFLFPAATGGSIPPPLWRFLSFTQNLGLIPGTAFSHAWSLCIEEQFYLALPLVVLAAQRCGSRIWQAWCLLGALLVCGIALRCLLWVSYGREAGGQIEGYYPNIYYASLCRFDEFLPGVAVALLKHLHPPAWARLIRHGTRIFWLGAAATAAMLYLAYNHYYIDGYGYGFFMTGFGYSLISIAFALLVIAALAPDSPLARIRVPGAASLALWSYAIYLSHKPLAYLLQRTLKPLDVAPALTLALITCACLLAGYLIHRFVESPFMRLRAGLVPTNFASAPAGGSGPTAAKPAATPP